MMNMLSKGKCNSKSKEEDSNFLKIQTCVLKVNIHCDGCKQKVKKLLLKIEGVYTVNVDVEQKRVSVSGNVDPDTLIRKLVKNGKHAELLSPKLAGGRNNQFQKLQVDNGRGGGKKEKGGGGQKQVPVMKQPQPQQTKGFNLKMTGFMNNPKSVKFDVPEDDDDAWSEFDEMDGDVFDEFDELDGFDDDFEVDLKQMKNLKPIKGGMPIGSFGGGGVKGDGNVQKKGAVVGGNGGKNGKKGGDGGGKKGGKNGGGKDGKGGRGGGNNPHAGTPFQMSAGGGGVGGPFPSGMNMMPPLQRGGGGGGGAFPAGMNMMPPQRCGNGSGNGNGGGAGGGNISMHPMMTHMRNGAPMSGQPPEVFSGGGNPYQQQQYLAAMMQQQQQQQQQQRMMMMNGGGGGGGMAYARAPPPVATAVNYMNPPPDFTHVFSDENTNSCSVM